MFKNKNILFGEFAYEQKRRIFENFKEKDTGQYIYASVDDVPDQLIRTPLQRVIQLMKRHRDIRFFKSPKHKPISIIITTLAAHLYQGESEVSTALTNIVRKMSKFSRLISNPFAELDEEISDLGLIRREQDGKWYIPNPVNDGENFADRWHENSNARASAFFKWVQWLREDLEIIRKPTNEKKLNDNLRNIFGKGVSTSILKKSFKKKSSLLTKVGKAALSIFSVPWRQKPSWPMKNTGEFILDARLSKHDGFRAFEYPYSSGSYNLEKNLKIRFTSPIFEGNCQYFWQVTNTGNEARESKDLRGGFLSGTRIHEESTKYTGDHYIQCFVIKDGECIARSKEFVVKIK